MVPLPEAPKPLCDCGEAAQGWERRLGKWREGHSLHGGAIHDFHPGVFKKSSPSQALAVSADLLTEAISLGLADFLF